MPVFRQLGYESASNYRLHLTGAPLYTAQGAVSWAFGPGGRPQVNRVVRPLSLFYGAAYNLHRSMSHVAMELFDG